jgi:dolichol kinase
MVAGSIAARDQVSNVLSAEIVRKAIHLLVALVPAIAAIDVAVAMGLLGAGTLFYIGAEAARRSGHRIVIVSEITALASRSRERGRFVLGPVTLAIGSMLALLLYPLQASTVAIFALAFGDGLASLVGKAVGGPRLPLTAGKTVAGSLACFAAVLVLSTRLGADPAAALHIAAGAALIEAYAPEDMDNILLPVGTGFLAARLLG